MKRVLKALRATIRISLVFILLAGVIGLTALPAIIAHHYAVMLEKQWLDYIGVAISFFVGVFFVALLTVNNE